MDDMSAESQKHDLNKKHTTGFHQGKTTHENTTTTPQTIQQLNKKLHETAIETAFYTTKRIGNHHFYIQKLTVNPLFHP